MNKIVFSDGKMFDTAAYPVELEPPIIAKKIAENGANQDYLRITLSATYADVLAYFVDNATYAIRQFDIGNLARSSRHTRISIGQGILWQKIL